MTIIGRKEDVEKAKVEIEKTLKDLVAANLLRFSFGIVLMVSVFFV